MKLIKLKPVLPKPIINQIVQNRFTEKKFKPKFMVDLMEAIFTFF